MTTCASRPQGALRERGARKDDDTHSGLAGATCSAT